MCQVRRLPAIPPNSGSGSFLVPSLPRAASSTRCLRTLDCGWQSIFSAVVFGALGFRGLHLLYAILLAWLPIQYIAINFLKFVIPPKIEIYLPKDATLHLRNGPRS
jgi:hypothetical protein